MGISGVDNSHVARTYTAGYGNQTSSTSKTAQDDTTDKPVSMQEMLKQKMEEIVEKIKNGDTEQSFQIGGQTFSVKEWDKLIKGVDEAIDSMKEATAEAGDKKKEEIAEDLIEELLRDRSLDE